MPESFFITGTDTSVGKTVVSALLCLGLNGVYWKPVPTGTREGTDTETVMRLAQLPRHRTLPETYRFKPPVSPHLAAQWVGTRIELRKIKIPAPVQVLELAVVLLGATISFSAIAASGLTLISAIVITVGVILAASYGISRMLGLPVRLSIWWPAAIRSAAIRRSRPSLP